MTDSTGNLRLTILLGIRGTHKSIGNASLGGAAPASHQNVPAGKHLQGVKGEIHPGQEATFVPSGGHDAAEISPSSNLSVARVSFE